MRVWPHDQAHFVAPPGERMARFHGLDPVRALERQANVGEVEDLHEQRVPMQGRWTRRQLLCRHDAHDGTIGTMNSGEKTIVAFLSSCSS
jgi:hypothetical protein